MSCRVEAAGAGVGMFPGKSAHRFAEGGIGPNRPQEVPDAVADAAGEG